MSEESTTPTCRSLCGASSAFTRLALDWNREDALADLGL